jgi:hypothetical protein
VIDSRGRRIDRVERPCTAGGVTQSLLEGCSAVCHGTAMYRRASVLSAGSYDPAAELAEDYDLWIRLLDVGRLENLAAELTRVRYHERSVSELHQRGQLECTRRIRDRARSRRGLPAIAAPPAAFRPLRDRESRQQFLVGICRSAWRLGERRTALAYALRAVSTRPFSPWLVRLVGHELRRRFSRAMGAA